MIPKPLTHQEQNVIDQAVYKAVFAISEIYGTEMMAPYDAVGRKNFIGVSDRGHMLSLCRHVFDVLTRMENHK
jgi:hypothetical protein